MPRYAARVFYDGRAYNGFQIQKKTPTVAGQILDALAKSKLIENFGEAKFQAASRTDSRASALAQTVAFTSKHQFSAQRINAYLPSDIVIWAWAQVHDEFDPRREAMNRHYIYALPNNGHDIPTMTVAAQELVGTHDFHNFIQGTEKPCVKTLGQLALTQDSNTILFNFASRSFARGMIRKIIHHLSEVGKGFKSPNDTRRLLDPKFRVQPSLSMAPAEFLLLASVDYSFQFSVDPAGLSLLKKKLLAQQAFGEIAKTEYSLL